MSTSTSLCANRTVATTITESVPARIASSGPSTANRSPSTTTPSTSETTGVVTVEAGTAWCTAPAENDICCRVSAATAATTSPYTRLPVYRGTIDTVVGLVHTKDVAAAYAATGAAPAVADVLRPALSVPGSLTADRLLTRLRETRNHLAVVIDEFGRVAGLITIEDVLEQIVGEIEDEFDIGEDEGDIFGLADKTYRVSGDTSIERVGEAFGVKLAATDSEQAFDTIGGLIAHEMGHVPKRGEHLLLCGLHFVVLHTKGGAVRWFKVSAAQPGAADTP